MRKVPQVGSHVTVAYLGSTHEAVVEEVHEDGRRVVVLSDDGEELTFVLTPLTGRYMADGAQTGPHLLFTD